MSCWLAGSFWKMALRSARSAAQRASRAACFALRSGQLEALLAEPGYLSARAPDAVAAYHELTVVAGMNDVFVEDSRGAEVAASTRLPARAGHLESVDPDADTLERSAAKASAFKGMEVVHAVTDFLMLFLMP